MVTTDASNNNKNRLILLEVNTNPALSLDNTVLTNLLPNVVDGAIELVLRCQSGPTKKTNENKKNTNITTIDNNNIIEKANGSSDSKETILTSDGSNYDKIDHNLDGNSQLVEINDVNSPFSPYVNLPGEYKLIFDEKMGFEYTSTIKE